MVMDLGLMPAFAKQSLLVIHIQLLDHISLASRTVHRAAYSKQLRIEFAVAGDGRGPVLISCSWGLYACWALGQAVSWRLIFSRCLHVLGLILLFVCVCPWSPVGAWGVL